MDLVRAQLDAIAARLAAHGSVAPGAEFAELAPEVPPALVAAVDGSSRTLLDGGAFVVVALRAGRVVVRDAEEVLKWMREINPKAVRTQVQEGFLKSL